MDGTFDCLGLKWMKYICTCVCMGMEVFLRIFLLSEHFEAVNTAERHVHSAPATKYQEKSLAL